MKTKKIIFCCLLLCATLARAATNVPYLDANGNLQTIETAIELTGTETELTDGWYLASGTLEYSATIIITGDVHLILEDGCYLNVLGSYEDDGIRISGTNSLSIYAQTIDNTTMGKLYTRGGMIGFTSTGGSGIGENNLTTKPPISDGNLTIIGGNITANGSSGGAGICSYYITINGGTVDATGYSGSRGASAGISCNVTINGGNVTANGTGDASGMSGSITINGGSVVSTASNRGAGIGGFGSGSGIGSPGGTIIIRGGDVTATGGGAGIGGGYASNGGGSGGTIIISGGTVFAKGGGPFTDITSEGNLTSGSAGIGGGAGGPGGKSGNILIYGEDTHVTAIGGGGEFFQDIGVGGNALKYLTNPVGSIFVALPKGNLIGTDNLEIGNPVLFTADPVSSDIVTAILPVTFDTENPIDLLTGLAPEGKTLSVITTLASQSFSLPGYLNSPSKIKGTDLMETGASVNFFIEFPNGVPYLDENENLQIQEIYTKLTGSETELTDGWYLASGPLKFSETLIVSGDVHLILEDECYMEAFGTRVSSDAEDGYYTYYSAIFVSETNSLTIYAQTIDANKMGKLNATGHTGIGGHSGNNYTVRTCGTIIINGGDITATSTSVGSDSGAGIGTGGTIVASLISGGNIIINGGIINASGSNYAAGIGGGAFSDGGNITINGGTIDANGGIAGIGGGEAGSCGIISINGGIINASASYHGAGIGGFRDGVITINDGTIIATGGDLGAGIGGSSQNPEFSINRTIIIRGGNITAIGGGAGIGGGNHFESAYIGGSGGNIIISGGTITATGEGAGIGGGKRGYAGNILIYGEKTKVTAKGGKVMSKDIGGILPSGGPHQQPDPYWIENIFVALPKGNLIGTEDLEIGNTVLFTANPKSSDIVTATLLFPFDTISPVDLLTGLSPDGKSMSVITTMKKQRFSLSGYRNSPITKRGADLMEAGISVDFNSEKAETPLFKWTGSVDSNWSNSLNWDQEFVPTISDTVFIPGKVGIFPDLTESTGSSFEAFEIHFKPGAQLGGQSRLAYGYAYVSYDFNNDDKRNRWLMLSIPLGEVYPGDFVFGGYPLTWMCTFSSKVNENVTTGTWVPIRGKEGNATPFSYGDGFVLWLNKDGIENDDDTKGLKLLDNCILELPYFHHLMAGKPEYGKYSNVNFAHTYENGTSTFYNFSNGDPIKDEYYTAVRHYGSSRLLKEAEENFSKTINFEDGIFALVGNPFMAALDYNKFYEANDNKIKENYFIWTGSGYTVFASDGSAAGVVTKDDPEGLFIAPLQGFIVEKAEIVSMVPMDIPLTTLTFSETMTTANPNAILRSSASALNKINIVARNPVAGVSTFIANREGGMNEFNNRDARKIINDISDVPEIYTLKQYNGGSLAVAINVINDDDLLIPLGLATSYTGNITLTFTGMDTYDAKLSLIDLETNETIDLTGLPSFEHVVNYTPKEKDGKAVVCNDRFVIRISKTATGLQETFAEKVNVFETNGQIRIVSGASNPVREVSVYNLQGMLMYKAKAINAVTHTIERTLPAGVYIVKVISKKNIDNVKLIIR